MAEFGERDFNLCLHNLYEDLELSFNDENPISGDGNVMLSNSSQSAGHPSNGIQKGYSDNCHTESIPQSLSDLTFRLTNGLSGEESKDSESSVLQIESNETNVKIDKTTEQINQTLTTTRVNQIVSEDNQNKELLIDSSAGPSKPRSVTMVIMNHNSNSWTETELPVEPKSAKRRGRPPKYRSKEEQSKFTKSRNKISSQKYRSNKRKEEKQNEELEKQLSAENERLRKTTELLEKQKTKLKREFRVRYNVSEDDLALMYKTELDLKNGIRP